MGRAMSLRGLGIRAVRRARRGEASFTTVTATESLGVGMCVNRVWFGHQARRRVCAGGDKLSLGAARAWLLLLLLLLLLLWVRSIRFD